MNEHREAVDQQRIKERIANAASSDEKRLAEVENAVLAAKQQLAEEAAEMSRQVAADRITQSVAQERIANRKRESVTLIEEMRKNIVEPIAKKVEDAAAATVYELPERTAVHMEASAHYAAQNSDGRQDLISAAVTGKDDVLAVALLTGRDPITDITRQHLMERLAPASADTDQILKLAQRVQDTLNTLEGASR